MAQGDRGEKLLKTFFFLPFFYNIIIHRISFTDAKVMRYIYIYICIVSIGSNVPAIKLFLVDNRERNTLTTVSIVLPLQINFSPPFHIAARGYFRLHHSECIVRR